MLCSPPPLLARPSVRPSVTFSPPLLLLLPTGPGHNKDHLHLHAIETPFLSWWQGMRFSEGKPWCASFENVKSAFCAGAAAADTEEMKVAGDEEQQA